jgi:hypothetical protein
MGHNSGRRTEEFRVASLIARDKAARDAQARTIVEAWCAELAADKRPQFSPTLEAAKGSLARPRGGWPAFGQRGEMGASHRWNGGSLAVGGTRRPNRKNQNVARVSKITATAVMYGFSTFMPNQLFALRLLTRSTRLRLRKGG